MVIFVAFYYLLTRVHSLAASARPTVSFRFPSLSSDLCQFDHGDDESRCFCKTDAQHAHLEHLPCFVAFCDAIQGAQLRTLMRTLRNIICVPDLSLKVPVIDLICRHRGTRDHRERD